MQCPLRVTLAGQKRPLELNENEDLLNSKAAIQRRNVGAAEYSETEL